MHLCCCRLVCRPTLRLQHKLRLRGGLTRSIFHEVEEWLAGDTDRQIALKYIAYRKNMDRYRSMIDFLFCEIFTRYQRNCFAYYENKGPQLRDTITEKQRSKMAKVLLAALKVAYELWCERRRESWGWLRAEALVRAA